ncbi:hypothetical protein [Streptomyces fuscigenes]|uniref:hypothetical protein n=1 Tax=Streptomyces fuscigenes TaxID=1528880 RepID=UPI001F28B697|nr:hypothetical protein [Streptomyces fuscigenes]MCF3961978.1 hypothetical protein [Streptomyces fuscigenes]
MSILAGHGGRPPAGGRTLGDGYGPGSCGGDMCAARRVRIAYELRAADAAPGGAAGGEAWWERSTRGLREGLAELGPDARAGEGFRADGARARFSAAVPAGVVSEAVRLTMSWIGRSGEREATLTAPHGDVLHLTGDPRPEEELDLIALWLTAATASASASGE